MFKDATTEEINQVMEQAWNASFSYRKLSLKERNSYLHAIADELENSGDEIIQTAMEETNLPEARLKNERARTVLQLRQYGDACEEGSWLQARIHTAESPKPSIRKTQVPLGPVVVFGSSNFPFAYSTAGGDTACALAAGCPVIVKAHPAHARTSEMVAKIILSAADKCGMPKGVFAHVHGAGIAVGKQLVLHERTCAVGFTGSLGGGKQLFDWGNQRPVPIPVFSEMGSVNPVFLLPEKLAKDSEEVAEMYAQSIVQGVGQFCTNPGLIIGITGASLESFKKILAPAIEKASPQKMLHPGIAKAYIEKRKEALSQKGVTDLSSSAARSGREEGFPTLASVQGSHFIENPLLHREVFGPFSLIVECQNQEEMKVIASKLEGQLTSTLMATEGDIKAHPELIAQIQNLCGRFIVNGVPTGVEVCSAMQHGGPFPSTTDPRFTSVGADGIRRFTRPVAFQNWPDSLLPNELKDANPLDIWRTVDDRMTKDSVQ